MAENERLVDSPPRHIDFSIIKKRTITKNNNNMLKSPMAGDRNYNAGGVATGDRLSVLVDTARMQLISPPPEEMLRKNPVYTLCFGLCTRYSLFHHCSEQVRNLRLHYWQILARLRLMLLPMAQLLQPRGKELSLYPLLLHPCL